MSRPELPTFYFFSWLSFLYLPAVRRSRNVRSWIHNRAHYLPILQCRAKRYSTGCNNGATEESARPLARGLALCSMIHAISFILPRRPFFSLGFVLAVNFYPPIGCITANARMHSPTLRTQPTTLTSALAPSLSTEESILAIQN